MHDTDHSRWNDKWQVKLMAWALAAVLMGLCSGGGWLIGQSIDAKNANVAQDGRIKALEDNAASIDKKLDKIDDKLDELRKPK